MGLTAGDHVGLTAPARLEVTDASGVSPVRRALGALSRQLALSEEDSGRASLVATELATNLVRHTPGGEILLRADSDAVEIIAWDHGPGIRNTAMSVVDGFSTAGGEGTGLGAVHRVADDVEMYSTAPGGTVIVARVRRHSSPPFSDLSVGEPRRPRYAGPAEGLVLAVAPEVVSGDAWGALSSRNGDTVLLADGLGHGPGAAEAAELAVAELRADGQPVEEILARVHDALRPTRGAAVAVAQVDRRARLVHFAGVGNIAAAICARDSSKSLASMSGTAGRQVRTLRSFRYELPDSGFLIMHSDGCRSGWNLYSDPQLPRRSPLLIAATLIRDWERGRDDVSVVVLPLTTDELG